MKFLNNSKEKTINYAFPGQEKSDIKESAVISNIVAILADAYGEIYCIGQKIQTDKFCGCGGPAFHHYNTEELHC